MDSMSKQIEAAIKRNDKKWLEELKRTFGMAVKATVQKKPPKPVNS